MNSERRTKIIAIRVRPGAKNRLVEMAQKRETTLTDFVRELINTGWDVVVKQNESEPVKQ